MTNDALLILNRKSASRPDVRAAVKSLPYKIEVFIPWSRKELKKRVHGALKKGIPRIIAGGGDGTLNKVANAILSAPGNKGTMAFLPLGTANDFARAFGDDGADIQSSLSCALTAAPAPIDVGWINGRAFINTASGGFGAMITATTDKDLKRRLGGFAYTLSGLGRLSELTATGARITLDGDPPLQVELLALAIGNSRYAGGGFDVAPEARLDDGFLDLGVLSLKGLAPDSDRVARLLDPQDETQGLVNRARFRSALIETETPFHLNLDGEPVVDTRFQVDVEPKALLLAAAGLNK